MRRAAPVIPVSSRLFRHFAVVTVVITAGLAMFADGENREAVAETIAQRQAKNAARQAEYDKSGNTRTLVSSRRAKGGEAPVGDSGGPADGGGGGSWEDSGASEGGGFDPSATSGGDDSPQDFAWNDAGADGPPNLAASQEFQRPPMLANPGGLQPDKSKAQLGKTPAAAKKPARPTRQQLEAMLAASRARSARPAAVGGEDE